MDSFLNKIICGDCLEVMKDIPDKSIDLVLTDPPYGIDFQTASFAPQHEVIWFATKGSFAFPQKRPPSVLRVKRVDAEKLMHPNEKPIDLMKYLISVTTRPNDVVADFFIGSGVTADAGYQLGRGFIGTELDEGYCEIARRRVEQAQAQGNIFEK